MAHDARHTPYGDARVSAQREAILRAIDALGKAFTAEELVGMLAVSAHAPGVATVYRALSALEESGYVVRVGEREGAALFAQCQVDGHHHHLVCEVCGRVTPIDCPLDTSLAVTALREGFSVTSHEVTLYGVCASCSIAGWDKEAH